MNTNPATELIGQLPASFWEVCSPRPRVTSHAAVCAWLDEVADLALSSADGHLHIAEVTGDDQALIDARLYLKTYEAIAAMRVPA